MRKKIFLAFIISIVAIFFAVAVGSVFISPIQTLFVVLNKLFTVKLPQDISTVAAPIIWELRLPRVLLAFLVGAALAVSGTVTQSVLKNPLASPFTLGVSSGASLGAAIIMISGFTLPLIAGFTLPFVGLVFGLATVFASVMLASRMDKNMESNTIILAGMVFSLFVNAILTLLSGLSKDNMTRITQWTMGSFAMKGWPYVEMMFPIFILGFLGVMFFARELDILTFGEEQAKALGVDTKRVKWLLLGLTAALTGAAVAFSGVIGFIDLIAPHVVRRFFGSQHRYVLPMSALFGGVFMVIADLVARTIISPSELPIGAVTAIIGAPFFAYVYFKREKKV
jgi:iron complex transport system permease protein